MSNETIHRSDADRAGRSPNEQAIGDSGNGYSKVTRNSVLVGSNDRYVSTAPAHVVPVDPASYTSAELSAGTT